MVMGAEASASEAFPEPALSSDTAAVLSAAGTDASFGAVLLPQPANAEAASTVLKSRASFFDLIINPPFIKPDCRINVHVYILLVKKWLSQALFILDSL